MGNCFPGGGAHGGDAADAATGMDESVWELGKQRSRACCLQLAELSQKKNRPPCVSLAWPKYKQCPDSPFTISKGECFPLPREQFTREKTPQPRMLSDPPSVNREADCLNRIDHPWITKPIGYCWYEPKCRMIVVYNRITGTLMEHLETHKLFLSWRHWMRVAQLEIHLHPYLHLKMQFRTLAYDLYLQLRMQFRTLAYDLLYVEMDLQTTPTL
ncbi:hypothetical protein ACFX2B_026725 [Malus domestica]